MACPFRVALEAFRQGGHAHNPVTAAMPINATIRAFPPRGQLALGHVSPNVPGAPPAIPARAGASPTPRPGTSSGCARFARGHPLSAPEDVL
jgi:hypothetical protein